MFPSLRTPGWWGSEDTSGARRLLARAAHPTAGAFVGGPGTTGKGARLGKAVSEDCLEFTAGPYIVCGYPQGAFKQVVCEFSVLPHQRSPGLVLPSEQAGGGSWEPPGDPQAAASPSATQDDGVWPSQVQPPSASAWVAGPLAGPPEAV